MNNRNLAIARISIGILGLIAIIAQLSHTTQMGWSVSNFFSFFTIQSNVLVILLLFASGIGSLAGITKSIASLRGALTLYISMTGVIYFLLLAGNETALQTTIPWVNIVLHYLIPVVVIVDWIVFPPKTTVSIKHAVLWLIYPIAYLLYSFVRGAITSWYPYPFLNPITTGWPNVVATCLIIAIGTVALAWLIAKRTPKAPRSR